MKSFRSTTLPPDAAPEPVVAAEVGAVTVPGSLSPTQREIVELCAETVQQFGLSRSVGQIFGVIYASPEPLAFADVMARLELSKGSVSQGLRFLRELGAIRTAAVLDDRRERFVPETRLRRLLAGLLRTRVRDPLRSGVDRLRAIHLRLEKSPEPEREFLRQRLASLRTWHRQALTFLPLAQRLIGS